MASLSTNPEASTLRRRGRQRLIGAVVLVLLFVVFVPMVLDSEPRPARQAPALDIPAKDAVAPLPPPPPAAKASEARAQPEPAKVEPSKPAAATTPAAAEPTRKGFAVQVGAFRDEAKLQQAQAKLQSAGVASYTEQLESKGGALTRLRAGPFATREQAEAAQAALKRATLEGKVIPLP